MLFIEQFKIIPDSSLVGRFGGFKTGFVDDTRHYPADLVD
jgi:hypothetical protein